MSSSLLIAGFDVLDPTSPVQLVTGFDRGAPVPSVAEIQSTVLDGAVVSGFASGNRQPAFTLLVRGTSRAGLAATANQVLQYVDQQSWTMQFTPDGGFPLIYDCFRATASISSSLADDAQLKQQIDIKCEALPYGRSPATVTLPLTGPTVQTLDGLDSDISHRSIGTSGPSGVTTVQTIVTSPAVSAPGALQVAYTRTTSIAMLSAIRFQLTHSSLSIAVTTAFSTVQFFARSDYAASITANDTSITGNNQWFVFMTGSSGANYTFVSQPGATPGNNYFQTIQASGPTVPAGETITQISIFTPFLGFRFYGDTTSTSHHLQFDSLIAVPAGTVGVSDAQGAVLDLVGVLGTARTAAAFQLAQTSAGTFTSWCLHTPPADSMNAQPLIPISGGAGSTAATVRYEGTYSIWVATSVVGGATPRTVTVVLSQTVAGVTTTTQTITASLSFTHGHGMYYVGDVSLPLLDYPLESSATTNVNVTSTNGADVFVDVLMLDTRGQTIICTADAPANLNAWVDAPDPSVAFGGVWSGTATDRSDAASVAPYLAVGSTLLVNPGNSQILVYSASGLLQGTVTYSPRWLQEATA